MTDGSEGSKPVDAAVANADSPFIPDLIRIGSDPTNIKKVQALAAKTMQTIGYKYPRKSCAATLSHFLRAAGINIPITTGAQNLADRLRLSRRWTRIEVGKQQPGDVGVCYSMSNDVPGADHVYLVVGRVDADLMVIADNQVQGRDHDRSASGRGGKTPTEYFLRAGNQDLTASGVNAASNTESYWPDENTNNLPEPFMDDGSPRLMNYDGTVMTVE